MSTTFAQDLESYNRFILQFQDRAYTLAVHLRGAGLLTESIVQDVLRESFAFWQRSGPQHPGFETSILRSLQRRCRQAGPILGPAGLPVPFNDLSCDEKLALILVDCLGYPFPEAAQILAWPNPLLSRILSGARLKFAPRLPEQV